MTGLDVEKIKQHWVDTSNDDSQTIFENSLEIQLELMRLRRKIDSRIEPHPFREKDFNITNPVAYEILMHGERIDSGII